MDKQAVFDRVAKHLLTQQARAMYVNENGHMSCAYRGADNMSCAVGCLIDDKYYTKDLEGESISKDKVRRAVALSLHIDGLDDNEITFLEDLQSVHDTVEPEDWKTELTYLASKYGLDKGSL